MITNSFSKSKARLDTAKWARKPQAGNDIWFKDLSPIMAPWPLPHHALGFLCHIWRVKKLNTRQPPVACLPRTEAALQPAAAGDGVEWGGCSPRLISVIGDLFDKEMVHAQASQGTGDQHLPSGDLLYQRAKYITISRHICGLFIEHPLWSSPLTKWVKSKLNKRIQPNF
jgi:hypothetical protein